MSIAGISAASSAIYTLQPQNTASAGTTAQAATPQTTAPALPATETGATQVRHHHHHGTGGAAPSPDLTQAGTTATDGTNILHTLV